MSRQLSSRKLTRRALFATSAASLGAVFLAVSGGRGEAPITEAYLAPTKSKHIAGCACPICSGSLTPGGRTADA